MKYDDILITGWCGLVGSTLRKMMPDAMIAPGFDLTKEDDVRQMYEHLKPRRVIHLAARVGGIIDNIKHPAEYLDENILMNTLMVKYAYKNNVERFLGVLSSCAYPNISTIYPMKESDMNLGVPSAFNFTYGMAKRILAIQIDAYNKEYGTEYNYITPCNIYGETENGDINKNHFIASLIKKVYEAVKSGQKEIILMGNGEPLRQHLYVNDFARIIKIIIDEDITASFNISPPDNFTIRAIAEILTKEMDLDIHFDTSFPLGQYRKDIDTTLFKSLIPDFRFTPLKTGLLNCYKYYEKNQSYK